MAEITQRVLEQLLDCTESEIPPLRVIHLMASEIMRMRAYGDMIPAPDEALKQKAAVLLNHLQKNDNVGQAYKRVGELIKEKFNVDSQTTIEEVLLFVAGESPSQDDSEWIEIATSMLSEIETIINDSVGFGRSGSPVIHNNALNELRKFLEAANGAQKTLVKKKFVNEMKIAVTDITYGHAFPQKARENLLVRLNAILPDADATQGVNSDE